MSTWNMPPGVTTNDIPGNERDDDTARELQAQSLLQRCLRQLERWNEKYGEWQPTWLPPAGDVELAEDVADFLKSKP